MEVENNWCRQISARIDRQKDNFTEKELKRYRLDVLGRMAGRLESLSADCEECERLKAEFDGLVNRLGELAISPKTLGKRHIKGFQTVMKHLAKRHKLTCEGDFTAAGLVLGMGIGTAIGASLNELAVGLSFGMCVGMATGALWETYARKNGRMI